MPIPSSSPWSLGAALSTLVLGACSGGGGGGGSTVSLAYDASSIDLTTCAVIAPIAPSATGFHPTHFEIAPALPGGLVLEASSGVLSGAPQVESAAQAYTIHASGNGHEADATITIAVHTETLAGLDYGGNLVFTRGVWGAAAPAFASGAAQSFTLTAGTLPLGLALDPVSGSIEGSAAVNGDAALTIHAASCDGQESSTVVTVHVAPPESSRAFVVHRDSPVIAAFAHEAQAARLRFQGHAPVLGASAGNWELALDPRGALLCVTRAFEPFLDVYRIDPDTGALGASSSSVTTGAAVAEDVAFTPDGRFLYAPTSANVIRQYRVVWPGGTLIPLDSLASHGSPAQIAVHPGGRLAFVSCLASNEIGRFAIDPATGGLSELGYQATSLLPYALRLDATGRHLYVASFLDDVISAYAVDATTGALAEIPGSPYALPAGLQASTLAIDGSSARLYAAGGGAPEIAGFALEGGLGTLVPLVPPTTAIGAGSTRLEIEPRGGEVFATGTDGLVRTFAVGSGGALEPVTVIQGWAGARGIAFRPGASALQFESDLLYCATRAPDRVFQYGIDAASGIPAALLPASIAPTGASPAAIDVHPALDFVYTANENTASPADAATVFQIDAAEQLVVSGGGILSTHDRSIAVEPGGRFVALGGGTALAGRVRSLAIGPASGLLTQLDAVTLPAAPGPAVFHPSGALCFVPLPSANEVRTLTLDPASGALAQVHSLGLAPLAPSRLAADPTGRFVLALHRASGQVSTLRVDLAAATLAPVAAEPLATAADPADLAVTHDAAFVFVGHGSSAVIRAYGLAPDGALSPLGAAIPAAGQVVALRLDCAGDRLYALLADGRIETFALGAAGALTSLGTVATGANPSALALRDRIR